VQLGTENCGHLVLDLARYENAMRAAAEVLKARSITEYVKAILLVRLFDHAGDTENALRWLEKGFEGGEPSMPYIGLRFFLPRPSSGSPNPGKGKG
jgi:hypothetical protein